MAETAGQAFLHDDKAASRPLRKERAEVDTSLPFESVKAAVSLFGEQAGPKKSRFYQQVVCTELHSTKAELKVAVEKLAAAEKEKEKVLHELEEARKLLEISASNSKDEIKIMTREGPAPGCLKLKNTGSGSSGTDNKYAVWETKLKATEERHTAAVMEMEVAMRELTDLKQELFASLMSKNDSVFDKTSAALCGVEGNVNAGQDLTTELGGINNWLSLLKTASAEANKEKLGRLSNGKATNEGLELGKEFEVKLISMMNESLRLKGEMKSAKDTEAKLVSAASDTLKNLEASRAILGSGNLSKAIVVDAASKGKDNRASLLSILESLHSESEALCKDVLDLKDNEARALVAANVSASELAKIRIELAAGVAAVEAKAMESMSGLSQALKRAEAETEIAKAETDNLREEAFRYRREAEARLDESVSSAMETLRKAEAEAAEAKGELEALRAAAPHVVQLAVEDMDAAKDAESEWISFAPIKGGSDALVTISREEYGCLKRKAQETEEIASVRVAASIGEAESLKEMLAEKIASANEDMENIKRALKQALHRAEMAEKAKSAMEEELKRLRDREQRRREKGMAMVATQQQNHTSNSEQSTSFSEAKQTEPLGRVLNINISAQRTKTLVRISSRKHRKSALSSLSSYLTKNT